MKEHNKTTNLNDIISFIKPNKEFLLNEFGVKQIGIFGSFVKDCINDDSDIDIVIEIIKERKTLHNFLELKRYLERNLQRKIDLGIESNLKKIIKNQIQREIVYV